MLAIAAAGVVGVAAILSGSVASVVATLIVIGFSPDRSELLAALVLEGVAVAVACLVAPRILAAMIGGTAVFGLIYHRTFESETRAALLASGAAGRFDALGWVSTVVTLAVAVAIVGWAVAMLATIVRAFAGRAVADLRRLGSGPRRPRLLVRPVVLLVLGALVLGTMPVLGDMLNYEPDVHMRDGAAGSLGLTGAVPPVVLPAPGDAGSAIGGGGLVLPGLLGAGAQPGVISSARPWLAWRPSGLGQVQTLVLPAPWGPSGSTVSMTVYLPPGYQSGSQRYPVLYEVPWGLSSWDRADNLPAVLDNLIDGGVIPATIVVFVSESGGPYPDSECVNSADGREWFATWLTQTVVGRIDTTYRTIATPASRAVMGFSQGGFCAPMLALRNPTVFGTSISYSGYFQAGLRSGWTPNAYLPFGGDPAIEAQYSPDRLASTIAPDLRSRLFFELSFGEARSFYGRQAAAFTAQLHRAGIPVALFPTPLGHAWAAIRDQLPSMLGTWAARMAALNVFG